MGVFIDLEATPAIGRFPVASEEAPDWLAGVFADRIVAESPFAPFAVVSREGEAAITRLCPIDEDITLRMDRGRLRVRARTCSAGPGYHAYLHASLMRLADIAAIRWRRWDAQSAVLEQRAAALLGERQLRAAVGAITSVFAAQPPAPKAPGIDFPAIRREHARDLRERCRAMLRQARGDAPQFVLGLPRVYAEQPPIADDAFVLTPLGPRDRAYVEALASAEGEAAIALAEEATPWWSPELDARAMRDIARALFWTDFAWAAPMDEHQRAVLDVALDFFKSAEAGADQRLRAAATEAEALKTAAAPSGPAADGLGYARLWRRRPLAGPWECDAPGWFDIAWREEDARLTFHHGATEIHVTTVQVGRPKGFDLEEARAERKESAVRIREGVLYAHDGSKVAGRDPSGRLRLTGSVIAPTGVAVMTALFETPEAEALAERMFNSISFTGGVL